MFQSLEVSTLARLLCPPRGFLTPPCSQVALSTFIRWCTFPGGLEVDILPTKGCSSDVSLPMSKLRSGFNALERSLSIV